MLNLGVVDEMVIDFYTVLHEADALEEGLRVYTNDCIYTYNYGALYRCCGNTSFLLKEFD